MIPRPAPRSSPRTRCRWVTSSVPSEAVGSSRMRRRESWRSARAISTSWRSAERKLAATRLSSIIDPRLARTSRTARRWAESRRMPRRDCSTPSVTFSATVSWGTRFACWKITLMPERIDSALDWNSSVLRSERELLARKVLGCEVLDLVEIVGGRAVGGDWLVRHVRDVAAVRVDRALDHLEQRVDERLGDFFRGKAEHLHEWRRLIYERFQLFVSAVDAVEVRVVGLLVGGSAQPL